MKIHTKIGQQCKLLRQGHFINAFQGARQKFIEGAREPVESPRWRHSADIEFFAAHNNKILHMCVYVYV